MADGGKRHSDLKRMLEQRRHDIMSGVLQEVRAAAVDPGLSRVGEVRDAGDEGEAGLQDEVRFALIHMKAEVASRIDRALERLAEGSYGVCDECAGPIAEARLQALPFVERCKACEELREEADRRRAWRPRTRGWRAGDPASRES